MIEEAVEKHQDYLFRFAYFRIGNRKDAEDVVQNVFLKVLDKRINLADERKLKMYLFRAVYHACIDYSRSAVGFVPIEDTPAVDDGNGTTDEELQLELTDTRKFEVTIRFKFNATKEKYRGQNAGESERNRL